MSLDDVSDEEKATRLRLLKADLKLKELETIKAERSWIVTTLSNPLTVLVMGGLITLFTQYITNFYTARSAKETAALSLQAELIKKFVQAPRSEEVRNNLQFLIDLRLLPDYEIKLKEILGRQDFTPPQVQAEVVERSSDSWSRTPPDEAYCFQRDFPVQAGRFLIRCFKTAGLCQQQHTADRGDKSPCTLVRDLLSVETWKSAGRGGVLDSWYRYSATPFGSPFPQIKSP